ncbi:Ger(x)C family spore germination protein [Alkalihalobacillus sp. MEB130]|uniref:Ger(x)C family spore germination protein n=1 Tax=Alkalihalobacillus sp. MEB130 TaxID=2976704 RepID=UPI0028DD8FEF|nr:Ger(x)C family spore germination protein [Alkalihalobacillus sp. MEB130]MDT8860773.1 Ger(x)C family spore germination protein [Alkalihalobacillus sp. MEB130]
MGKAFVLTLLATLVFISGCWDRQELTEIGLVAAMAIDKDPETGLYDLTAQFLRPAAESTLTPSPDRPYLMVSTTGDTIIEVMRKANQTIDRQGFYAHNKVIVIHEDVAKEGITPIFDSFKREKDIRGHVWVCVAKDTSAKSLLDIKANNISRIPADYLEGLIDQSELSAASINVLNFYKQTLGKDRDPVAGLLSLEETDHEPFVRIKLSGGAVFNNDKLKGFLDPIEARGYNWITKKKLNQMATLTVPSLLEENKMVTLLIQELDAKITPTVSGGNPFSFVITVKPKGRLAESQATNGADDRKAILDFLADIEKEAEKKIEEEIKLVVDKAQQDFKADIFGFGRELNKDYPDVWNKVAENWNEIFTQVPYTVHVDVTLDNTGLIQGTIEAEE